MTKKKLPFTHKLITELQRGTQFKWALYKRPQRYPLNSAYYPFRTNSAPQKNELKMILADTQVMKVVKLSLSATNIIL